MPKKKVKGSIIPPLDFIAPVSAGKIPFNNEFIQCTAKHPPVRTVVSNEQPPWIEPHFDSSKQRQPHPRATSAFACRTSSCKGGSVIGPLSFSSDGQALQKTQDDSPKVKRPCPLVPLVTPPPASHSGKVLVYETPQR
ncbi:hypothetical protein TcWFU_001532 [Taenia crassiceps]|uniref:Uncharacterized protein n=1 Tax=Taenia crassiceps TaxID=6207 RepID=A0ABR4QG24_9CEST